MPAPTGAAPERIRDANIRYHDAAAAEYDAKWGIDFGGIGHDQVREKMARALGGWPDGVADALEIGAGTGYFGLNLLQLGLFERLTSTDISQGMLDQLGTTAAQLELDVETVQADAEELPFEDESFDLVFGHAVLHHVPDLPRALAEFRRVLRPGGQIAFCGEPSRYGDAVAALPKQAAMAVAPLWRRAVGASALGVDPHSLHDGHELESEVDVHAFTPAELREMLGGAGFERTRLRGEELLANAYGWWLRSLEATAEPSSVPMRWRNFAFRSYMAVQRMDRALLEPRLPPALFYNLVLSARKGG
jgi:ubiquinone/menaquinone biosynthesis C-methylase UbiE